MKYEDMWKELEKKHPQFKKARDCADLLKKAWEEMNKAPTAKDVCEALSRERNIKWQYNESEKSFEDELGYRAFVDRYGDLILSFDFALKTTLLICRYYEAQK